MRFILDNNSFLKLRIENNNHFMLTVIMLVVVVLIVVAPFECVYLGLGLIAKTLSASMVFKVFELSTLHVGFKFFI
jgi:uncharacterized membrane protein (DUF485 family)